MPAMLAAHQQARRRPPGRRRPLDRLAKRQNDPCQPGDGSPLGVKSWTWQWGCVAGALVVLILLVVLVCWCCRRRGHRPNRAWAHKVMHDWQQPSHRRSHDSEKSSAKATPTKTDYPESHANMSYAIANTPLPIFAAPQPTYVIQAAPAAPASQQTVTNPDALFPRAPPSVEPMVSGFGAPASSASRWFAKAKSSAGSDSGSKGSKKRAKTVAPTYKGSEGGSSYHSDGLVSSSGFAFSAHPQSSAPGSSAAGPSTLRNPYSEAGGGSTIGGSSYRPCNSPWGSSDVGISSDFDGTSTAGPSRKAPSRTNTGYSQSAAPSAGGSRLRNVLHLCARSFPGQHGLTISQLMCSSLLAESCCIEVRVSCIRAIVSSPAYSVVALASLVNLYPFVELDEPSSLAS